MIVNRFPRPHGTLATRRRSEKAARYTARSILSDRQEPCYFRFVQRAPCYSIPRVARLARTVAASCWPLACHISSLGALMHSRLNGERGSDFPRLLNSVCSFCSRHGVAHHGTRPTGEDDGDDVTYVLLPTPPTRIIHIVRREW